MSRQTLTVIQISEMSNKNGPGLRTMIHLKGCPLRCLWCSTPESQNPEPEIMFDEKRCIVCGKCIATCPNQANQAVWADTEKIIHLREKCTQTLACTAVCPTKALSLSGKKYTPEELVSVIKRGKPVFDRTGGGVTISGGEPLYLADQTLICFMQMLKQAGISIGIDTAGHVPWEHIKKVIPFTDFFLWDFKQADSEKHKLYTGVGNELILENLHKLDSFQKKIYLRCPVIPGYTDDRNHIQGILKTALSLNSLREVHLIPLHHYGAERYKMLGKTYPLNPALKTDPSAITAIQEQLIANHIPCKITGG